MIFEMHFLVSRPPGHSHILSSPARNRKIRPHYPCLSKLHRRKTHENPLSSLSPSAASSGGFNQFYPSWTWISIQAYVPGELGNLADASDSSARTLLFPAVPASTVATCSSLLIVLAGCFILWGHFDARQKR